MTYKQFKTDIVAALSDHFPDDVEIVIHQVIKNNDQILDGLVITQKDINISPTIYLNYYYEQLITDDISFDHILQEILSEYQTHQKSAPIDISFFSNYNIVKDQIIYRLINHKRNSTLLKDVPFLPYLDLAIVFCVLLESNDDSNATILIHNSHLSLWNLSANDLFSLAMNNTPKLMKASLRNMEEVLTEYFNSDDMMPPFQEETSFDHNKTAMYVLSNQSNVHGACCILYQNLLEKFAQEIGCDLYILPSSIHEVLLIPANGDKSRSELDQMIHEVNDTQVADEEVLADHAYYFSMQKNSITC